MTSYGSISPFALGNLSEQLGLDSEPNLNKALENTLHEASTTEAFDSIVHTLPPTTRGRFSVSITHDIDWLDPYHPYAWLQSAIGWANAKPRIPFKQLWKRDVWLRNCEHLLQTEQQHSIQSIWCLGAQPTEGIGRYDIRYSAHNPLLKELIALIQQYHQEIGLHSSLNAVSSQSLQAEKEHLQVLTGKPVRFHRSHYLNARPTQLYQQLDTCGIAYDLGWGYARKVALKQGMPGMFKPLHPGRQTLHKVTVVPLVLMDNVLFVKPQAEVLQQFSTILSSVQTFNGTVCLLLHPENFLLKPDLWDSFTQIIDICKQYKAAFLTPYE